MVEKLASLRFESFGKANKHRKYGVFIDHAYRLHPIAGHVLSANAQYYVGNGCQQVHVAALTLVNPWCMHRRVTVIVLRVCICQLPS